MATRWRGINRTNPGASRRDRRIVVLFRSKDVVRLDATEGRVSSLATATKKLIRDLDLSGQSSSMRSSSALTFLSSMHALATS